MDENEVMSLVDSLYNMISEAWGVPLGNDKCIIERDKFMNILDEIKAQLPVEVAEAKRLVTARDEFIGSAKREAESIRKVQQALADSLQMLNEKAPNEQVIKLKAVQAMEKVADGKATKIIIPSEMQGLVGLANGIVEGVKE